MSKEPGQLQTALVTSSTADCETANSAAALDTPGLVMPFFYRSEEFGTAEPPSTASSKVPIDGILSTERS